MNERQAAKQGYVFTGKYSSFDKEKMKKEAKKLRDLGNKAMVVVDGGYSVYWIESKENKIKRKVESTKQILISQRNKLFEEIKIIDARLESGEY